MGEILDRCDAVARGLQKMNIKPSEKVMIYAENSLEWFIASLALVRINATTITLLPILSKCLN